MSDKTMKPSSLFCFQTFFVLLWSSGFIAIVFGLRYANPFTLLFYRMLFAAALMLLISWLTKAPWPRNGTVLKKTVVTGLLTQFLYLSTYFYALYYHVAPTVMSIILALQPLLTAVIYSLILKKEVTSVQYFGLVLGLAGVIITIAHDLSTEGMTVFSFIIAMTCLGAITIGALIQKSNPDMDLRTGSTIQFAVSLIPLFVLNLIFGAFKLPFHPVFLLSLGWMVIIISVTGNCLYYKLLKDGSAVKVNSLFYLMPPMTAVFCYFILGQPINAYILAGMALIVAGVLITQKGSAIKQKAA